MENTRRLLQRYRSRRRFVRLSPKESFPCAPDYFCLVWLWKRWQTYAVRLRFKITSSNSPVIPSAVEGSRRITFGLLYGILQLRFASVRMTVAVATAFFIVTAAPAHAREVIHKGDVVVVPLHGEVAPSLLAFLRRAVKTAENNQAPAIIFDMNTYGGRLDTATDIVNALNQIKIPTYTFINTNAGSAGALIVIATQHIYMAPVSAIGAAAPILSTGEDLPATAKEKTISYWSE